MLYLRRLRTSIKALEEQLFAYELLSIKSPYFSRDYRDEMLKDLYKMKDRYNSEKYFWMRKA